MKVLLIESHSTMFERLAEVLQECGLEYGAAMCLEEAQLEIEEGEYDAVILPPRLARDVDGPTEVVGFNLIPIIRKFRPQARIIASLGVGDPDVPDKGGKDFPEKSFRKMHARSELPPLLEKLGLK